MTVPDDSFGIDRKFLSGNTEAGGDHPGGEGVGEACEPRLFAAHDHREPSRFHNTLILVVDH